MQYDQVIFDCEKIMIEMKKAKNLNQIIERPKIDLVIKIINEFIVNNEVTA